MPASYNTLTGFNFAANVLLTAYEHTSPDFGTAPGGICGAALIFHGDEIDLKSDAIVKVMVDYINIHFLPKFELVLSKEGFHSYFEERRRLAIADGKPFMGKPESPVLQKYPKVAPACGGCWKLPSSTLKLSMCAKCKVRHYCFKECQKGNWATHKKACKVKL
ncbi:unnamed protein product [Zymoseptoria tritici ST99CH_3D1]|nr:unnamed protein product [Zymoseptoria tritici ST99CH_3D1]